MVTREGTVEAHSRVTCFVFLVSFLLLFPQVQAADYSVGVKVGDWIKYGQITTTWVGNGTEPSRITDVKRIDWIKVEVESIQDTTVSFNATWHYNNGTLSYIISESDVESNALNVYSYLIASNLKSGDPIENSSTAERITETITGRYAGADKKVNVLNFTSTFSGYTAENTYYWDQNSGIMVEWYDYSPDYHGGYTEYSMKTTETNIWSPDLLGMLASNLLYVVTVIALIAIAAALILVQARRRPPRNRQGTLARAKRGLAEKHGLL